MTCIVGGCVGQTKCRGLCPKHYSRLRRHGDTSITLTVPEQGSDEDRLNYYGWTITDTGCWEWNGPRMTLDYGRVGRGGARVLAHRLAYETWVGPIPEGLVVRHRCDNPPCINPNHLEIGTQKDNVHDMHSRNRRLATKIREDSYPEIARLYYVEGLKQSEVGEVFGVAQITISRHMAKMRKGETDAARG